MNRIITIGREFGSGGRELGRRLSERLGLAYYDQEIIEEIAEQTSLSKEYVKTIVEKRPVFSYPIHTARTLYPQTNPVMEQNLEIYSKQHQIIKDLAEESECVIVGRCADYILRDMEPFRIFVFADIESRMQRTREKSYGDDEVKGLSDKDLKRSIERIDRGRAKYYEFYTGQKWGARLNYDILVNTTGIHLEAVAEHVAALFGSCRDPYKEAKPQ